MRINRSAAVVKGGRRFSFSALVVVGNRNGTVGIGYGKARDVPSAVEKAVKDGRKHLMHVRRVDKTIPHQMEGQFGASRVRIIPAAPGTGIIAGAATRAVLELSLIHISCPRSSTAAATTLSDSESRPCSPRSTSTRWSSPKG